MSQDIQIRKTATNRSFENFLLILNSNILSIILRPGFFAFAEIEVLKGEKYE